ncbi:MAG: hypothetical protein AB1646_17970 [Thermodesulfobacteriota bacterium]
MDRRCWTLLSLLAIAMLGAGTGITRDACAPHGVQVNEMRTFQRAVGGLGLGAIAVPMWQFLNYDFRIQPVDDSVSWPVPGGYSYGPDRTATVSYFQEVAGNEWVVVKP